MSATRTLEEAYNFEDKALLQILDTIRQDSRISEKPTRIGYRIVQDFYVEDKLEVAIEFQKGTKLFKFKEPPTFQDFLNLEDKPLSIIKEYIWKWIDQNYPEYRVSFVLLYQ